MLRSWHLMCRMGCFLNVAKFFSSYTLHDLMLRRVTWCCDKIFFVTVLRSDSYSVLIWRLHVAIGRLHVAIVCRSCCNRCEHVAKFFSMLHATWLDVAMGDLMLRWDFLLQCLDLTAIVFWSDGYMLQLVAFMLQLFVVHIAIVVNMLHPSFKLSCCNHMLHVKINISVFLVGNQII
jgi:hypothetical protein